MPMPNQLLADLTAVSPSAFMIWLGQWRLNTIDDRGCLFVLRFVLSAFRSRPPEDQFWAAAAQFLGQKPQTGNTISARDVKILLGRMIMLEPEQARTLLAHFSQVYAAPSERFFWNTVGDAIQLYSVVPPVRAN
jgi:hypothetical protein